MCDQDQLIDMGKGAVSRREFGALGAMAALAALRPELDQFFDKVLVNVDDAALRRNRLFLLSTIQAALGAVADFGAVEDSPGAAARA